MVSRASARASIAGLLGFDAQDQTRIATAVSEIARNAFQYAGGGRVEFSVEGRTRPQIFASASATGARHPAISTPSWTAATLPRPAWAWASWERGA